MVIAVVGSGGKTTLVKKLASEYQEQGKTVLITTTTHMYTEEETLLTDDAEDVIRALNETGYIMAGVPEGEKIKGFSEETYEMICNHADVILVEADGSKHMPLKYPNAHEPVIPDNTDRIIIVCGLKALGQKAKEACHRLELVKACLQIEDDTLILPEHIFKLVWEGYVRPLRKRYPNIILEIYPTHDGSEEQKKIAEMISKIV